MTSTTIEIAKVWFMFSFSLGCWTCLTLLIAKRGDTKVKYTILCFILLLLIPPLNAYVTLINSRPIDLLLALSQKLTWCYGPIMIALIRHILLKPISRISYAIQSLPFIVAAVHDIAKFEWLTLPMLLTLLFIQVFSYLGYAVFLLYCERTRLLVLTQQFKNSSYYWLIYLVSCLFFIMLFDVAVFTNVLLGNIPSVIALATIAGIIGAFVNSIALFSIFQPDVFFHAPAPQETIEIVEKKSPVRSIELSPEAAQQLDEQLQLLVKKYKPHLDENISLPKLAALLGVTSHQLSELLNIHKSTSFYDFLNDLRHQETLHFLAENENELTITDIAYRSGFNNRNTFYKVFKEKTGLTPNQYKKTMV
jgi:AraC-like DNA-binding protein